jgi:hypothetical protein
MVLPALVTMSSTSSARPSPYSIPSIIGSYQRCKVRLPFLAIWCFPGIVTSLRTRAQLSRLMTVLI